MAGERLHHREIFWRREGIDLAPAKHQPARPGRGGGHRDDRRAILHQRLVGSLRAVPFQHGEFRRMQRAAFAIAKHAGELEDAGLAGAEQLLAGELRRGAQIARGRRCAGREQLGRKGVQMSSRCRARPAAPRSRPRRSRAPRTSPAAPPRCGNARSGPAGGRRAPGGPRTGTDRPSGLSRTRRPRPRKSLAHARRISMLRPNVAADGTAPDFGSRL